MSYIFPGSPPAGAPTACAQLGNAGEAGVLVSPSFQL